MKPADPGYDLIPQRFQRSIAHVTSPTSLTVESPQGRKLFVFDRVFGEDVTQDGIWEYVSESIDAFVQGYNVSVLAYGQSGSGKSYTMGTAGPHEQVHPEVKGKGGLCCLHFPLAACADSSGRGLMFVALKVLFHERLRHYLRSSVHRHLISTSPLAAFERHNVIRCCRAWQPRRMTIRIGQCTPLMWRYVLRYVLYLHSLSRILTKCLPLV